MCAQESELARFMHHLRSVPDTLQKYVLLANLKETDRELYYLAAVTYTSEIMPLVYTPVVRPCAVLCCAVLHCSHDKLHNIEVQSRCGLASLACP